MYDNALNECDTRACFQTKRLMKALHGTFSLVLYVCLCVLVESIITIRVHILRPFLKVVHP